MKFLAVLACVLLPVWLLGQSPCTPLTYPDLPPWEIPNPLTPWKFSSSSADDSLSANLYLKYRCNPESDSLQKPFVFVEGIDFNSASLPLRNGDFGWAEFTAQNATYPMLYNMPDLLDDLRAMGYDVLLVDFSDGAADIWENAALLQDMLLHIQQWTIAGESLVLAGASMGGQITRIALSQMEQSGVPHCCRLWISLDSPHHGAIIPLGLQHCLDFLAEPAVGSAQAQLKWHTTLQRPAARQLLRQQLPSTLQEHVDYQDAINTLGFPQDMRTIGIANGAMDGTPQNIAPGDMLFSHAITVPLLDLDVLRLDAYAAPGSNNRIFEGTFPTAYEPLYASDPCDLIPTEFVEDALDFAAPLALDHVPGGKRNTIEELALQVNDGIVASGCNQDTLTWQVDAHTFIPTSSALGMPDAFLAADIANALNADPSLSPFDVTHGPVQTNEWHSEVSDATAALILREVLAGENPLPAILDANAPNQGSFNYRDSATYLLYSVEVLTGGVLQVMSNAPRHWGGPPAETTTPDGGHFELLTSPCGAQVTVAASGRLELGTPSGTQTAALHVRAGSALQIRQGGEVVVHAGSSLIVDPGAELSLQEGTLRIEHGGSVRILEGGSLRMGGGELYLHGSSSLHIAGAFELGDGVLFQPQGNTLGTGCIHFYHEQFPVVGENAKVRLQSVNPTDVLLRLHADCSLTWPPTLEFFKVRNGVVQLDANAHLELNTEWVLRTGSVLCPTQDCEGMHLSRYSYFRDADIHDVPIHANLVNGLLRMEDCFLEGTHCSVFVKGRTYDIVRSTFHRTQGVGSSALAFNAVLEDCTFDEQGSAENPEAVYDHSEQNLVVNNCRFLHCNRGVSKSLGSLFVGCSTFEHCIVGVEAFAGTKVYMNSLNGAGYNDFQSNHTAIRLEGAEALYLKQGYNRFRQTSHQWILDGWMPGTCTEECTASMTATANTWSEEQENGVPNDPGPGPDPLKVGFFFTDGNAACFGDPQWGNACPVTLADLQPSIAVSCLAGTPKPWIGKSHSEANTLHLYPNPSSGTSWIQNETDETWWLDRITDQAGRILATQPFKLEPGGRHLLEVNRSGVYFVRLANAQGVQVLRWAVTP